MSDALDSTVLVAALARNEEHHVTCASLLRRGGFTINAHALVETFCTLTGGRLQIRIPGAVVVDLIQERIIPRVSVAVLAPRDLLTVISEATPRGVRGGAIYDYLHLFTARREGASRIYTLNVSHFRSFHRSGDPEIVHP